GLVGPGAWRAPPSVPRHVERLIQALEAGPAERDALHAARHRMLSVPREEQAPGVPQSLTSFVGRESELDELRRLVGANRLVTLTGVGGVGKTRLAAELARDHLDIFEHGVYFVSLVGVATAGLLASAIADALGLSLR